MSTCRSCRREIEWVVVSKSGKNMPIDPFPRDDGNIAKLPTTDARTGNTLVEYVMGGGGLFDSRPLYVSHFTTCPDADQHRRGGS